MTDETKVHERPCGWCGLGIHARRDVRCRKHPKCTPEVRVYRAELFPLSGRALEREDKSHPQALSEPQP